MKMKKLIAVAAVLAMILGLTALSVNASDDSAVPTWMTAEEQIRVLDENRSLWAFDEDEYAPDWYYTFTDFDHNGLLEVLSASTQGSGIFTYVRFYEVLPDGSGVKDLYHADGEIEGPDDWPEIIRDTLTCYYDEAGDRYYYVCANDTRDGAAHAISQLAALCLKDGVAEWEYLASADIQWTEDGEQMSYTDANGDPISEEDFDSATERRFAGMEQSEMKLDWIAVTPSAAEAVRQDGERFEAVIVLEGMEETVRYEHIRNESLGFGMDYEYESLARRRQPDREYLFSVWDDPDAPENYLEVTYSAEDADTAAASVRERLSETYDLLEETRELDRAGSCVYIEAAVLKGTNLMADALQTVYIIPARDGCLIAAAHFSAEAAEGFGRRIHYMLNTLAVTDGNGARRISDELALSAIESYCYASNPDLESIVNAGEYQVNWEVSSSDENEIVVLFRSYTGAQISYHIDPVSGETYVTEFVPGVTSQEEPTDESLNLWDYLDSRVRE